VLQSKVMGRKDFLAEFLGNPARARIVRFLVEAGEAHHTSEHIGKKTQINNRRTVSHELEALARLGLLHTASERRTQLIQQRGKKKKKKKIVREKVWSFDYEHPHAQALRLFVRDTQAPIDGGIVSRLRRAGKLQLVVVSRGFLDDVYKHSGADMLIVGEVLQEEKIQAVLRDIEVQTGCEVKYAIFSPKEFKYRLDVHDRLIRDVLDYPHHVLLDKLNFF
jgi:DNA-binding transcriptional ArsR family regulator